MQNRDTVYIDGQWVTPANNKSIEVISASTEEVMGHIPECGEADVAAAVAAARAALDSWSRTPPAKRGEYLQKIHEGLKARSEELTRTITGEVGMPLKMSVRIQVGLPISHFGVYAKMAGEFQFEERIGNSLVLREPVGVVACITPWNYPLHQIGAKVAPALAAGCTVVLKPSEVAPLNAFILAEIIAAAGVPAGVFNLVTGYGPVVGEALVTHPDVDMVSFTGSTRTGKRIGELAAQTVKRVSLELGGKSAAIILDDADFPAAVKSIVNACFLNSGQTCNALGRMLVPESRYAEAAKLAVEAAQSFTVGDPFADVAKLGPVASGMQRDIVVNYIKSGQADGFELLSGGPEKPEGLAKGYYVKPTIFGRVKSDSRIAQEEIFGPVLALITYKDEDEAVKIANGTLYGLAAAVWASSDARAAAVARRLNVAQVEVNGGPFNILAPFGGCKQSGNGRELGKYGLEEYLEYKSLQFKPAKV